MNTIQYKVTGMTCGGCVNRVQATLEPFAKTTTVTLEPPMATLSDASSDMESLNQALATVGKYRLSALDIQPTVTSVKETTVNNPATASWFKTYQPLLLVFVYILLVTLAVEGTYGDFILHRWMPHFMAGFFLIFSFFKLLDVRGFASSYAMYDLLAKRLPIYGLIYPFIELALGVAYVLNWQPFYTNLATFVVMTFSSVGVILAVLNKQKIRCACLGAVFNLPMSTITIIEDLLMAAMALWMLI